MRPAGEAEGDAASGGVARAAGMAARDDLAGAVAELAKLPPSERAPAESWIKQAQARAAAIDAGRRLAADALPGLGKGWRSVPWPRTRSAPSPVGRGVG